MDADLADGFATRFVQSENGVRFYLRTSASSADSSSVRTGRISLRSARGGDEHSGAAFFPILADLGEKVIASCPHLADGGGRDARGLVLRGPEDQLHDDGGEIDPFGGQAIDHFAPVLRIAPRPDD